VDYSRQKCRETIVDPNNWTVCQLEMDISDN
jgi:hypothetical protein